MILSFTYVDKGQGSSLTPNLLFVWPVKEEYYILKAVIQVQERKCIKHDTDCKALKLILSGLNRRTVSL